MNAPPKGPRKPSGFAADLSPEAQRQRAQRSRGGRGNAQNFRDLTPEQKARMSAGNTAEKGRKGRAASPWNNAPMCEGRNAAGAFARARMNCKQRGK